MILKILKSDDIHFIPENKEDREVLNKIKNKQLLVTGNFASVKTW